MLLGHPDTTHPLRGGGTLWLLDPTPNRAEPHRAQMMNTPKMMLVLCLTCLLSVVGCASDPAVPTTPEAEFTPLFDGRSLKGWRAVGGDAAFTVDKGEIVGVCENTKKNSFLRTERQYDDFEFRCQFKWDTPGNSGVQFRSHQYPSTDPLRANQVYGYQFELDSSARAWSGGLYEEGRRGWLVNLEGDSEAMAMKRNAVNLEGWNDIVIQCKGDLIRTWLNGVSIVNHRDTEGFYPLSEGFFALQVHAGGKGTFRWRNLRIKEYEPED